MPVCGDVAVAISGIAFIVFGLAVCYLGVYQLVNENLAGFSTVVFGGLSVVFGAYLVNDSYTSRSYRLREQNVELRVLEDPSCLPTRFVAMRATIVHKPIDTDGSITDKVDSA